VGSGSSSNIGVTQYFIESKVFKLLNDSEKAKTKELLKIFGLLNTSSLTPEGIENILLFVDYDGKMKVFDRGLIFPADEQETQLPTEPITITFDHPEQKVEDEVRSTTPVVQSSTVEQEILDAYRGDTKMEKRIAKEEAKMAKKFKDDVGRLRQEFFAAVQKKKVEKTVAILRLMTRQDDIAKFIQEDTKLNKFLSAIWEKQYGAELAEEFKQKPDDLKFIRLFLQYVLQDRLGLSRSDAARIGLQLSNLFVSLGKKEYNKMAYFDIKNKIFDWF